MGAFDIAIAGEYFQTGGSGPGSRNTFDPVRTDLRAATGILRRARVGEEQGRALLFDGAAGQKHAQRDDGQDARATRRISRCGSAIYYGCRENGNTVCAGVDLRQVKCRSRFVSGVVARTG